MNIFDSMSDDVLGVIGLVVAVGLTSSILATAAFIRRAYHQKVSCGLHDAARDGEFEKVAEYIGRGDEVNGIDYQNGLAPLHYALLKKEYGIASLLIDNGAALYTRSSHGRTPMDYVQEGEAENVRKLILRLAEDGRSTKDGRTPLHLAAEAGDLELSGRLLKGDFDLDGKSATGMTPLASAVLSSNRELVAAFIASGADIDAQDCFGRTPLLWAAITNSVDAAGLLLDSGAHADLVEAESGMTALHFAALADSEELAGILIEKGASPRSLDFDSHNPYELAVNTKHFGVANLVEKALKSWPVDVDYSSMLHAFMKVTYENQSESLGTKRYHGLEMDAYIDKCLNSVVEKCLLKAFEKRPPEPDEFLISNSISYLLTNKALYCILEKEKQLYDDIKIFILDEVASYSTEKESVFKKRVRIRMKSGREAVFSTSDFPQDDLLLPSLRTSERV